ncbi:CD225/dispanin family protein [Amycolatopsis sp. NPDC026612]|uniref:CD225/dispanin family protein n=1 Tax=Amycolatopsis sp. NPDC026612 TaxID=3155466 RepID=UPI0033F57FD0
MTDSQGMPNYPGDQPNQPGGQPNYPGGQPGGYQPGPPPSNHLVWAILSLLCCWPLAIVAIVQAAKVNGLWAQGQTAAAQQASAAAKKWAIIAASIGVVLNVLVIILYAAGVFTTQVTTSPY